MLLSSSFGIASRSYATLKDIQLRLKSIKNIGKITKSMKMIASTKLNRAQKAMEVGRTFGSTASALLKHVANEAEKEGGKTPSQTPLIIACSSDRGLCGAIHSSVSKFVKKTVSEDHHPTAQIVVLGDKAKPQIARGARKNIVMSFNQIGKDIPTFTDAIDITEQVLPKLSLSSSSAEASPENRPLAMVVYNQFKSVIAYETTAVSVPDADRLASMPKLAAYEVDPVVLEAFGHFLLAAQIFAGLVEGHASEMSAKRMAMENASKNSDEIVLSLTMQYNRTRQAVITNELVDIITGASAL